MGRLLALLLRCKHETITIVDFASNGMAVYECGRCGLGVKPWEYDQQWTYGGVA